MALTQVETSGLSGSGPSSNSTTGNVFSQVGPFKNRIINGAMAVDQRNAGAAQTITAGAALAYTVDRWYAYCTGANVTGQRVAGSGSDQYRYRFTGAASVTAIGFAQRIEQLNSYDLNGTTATLSVDLANSLLTSVTWTAYYANTADTFGSLASPTRTQIATGTFTVTSTVTRYSTQISIPAAATTGIEIVFTVGAQTSGTWTIGDIQLEAGAAATPFERVNYRQTLSSCQRYYYRLRSTGANNIFSSGGQCYSVVGALAIIQFPVTLRSAPSSLEQSGTAGDYRVWSSTTSAVNLSAVPVFSATTTTSTAVVDCTVASGLTAGNSTELLSSTSNAYLGWSAEL